MKKYIFEKLENKYNELVKSGYKRISANKLYNQFLFSSGGTMNFEDVDLFIKSKMKRNNAKLWGNNIFEIHKNGCVYAEGEIKKGNKVIGRYFKLDKITEDILQYVYGKITIGKTYKQYAKELISDTIFYHY